MRLTPRCRLQAYVMRRQYSLRSKYTLVNSGIGFFFVFLYWAGHVSRMQNDRWAKVSTQWVPRRGWPKERWQDDLDAHCNGWFEVAFENTTWKDVGEVFL